MAKLLRGPSYSVTPLVTSETQSHVRHSASIMTEHITQKVAEGITLTLIRSENQTQQITEDRLTEFWFLPMGDVFDATKLANQVQELKVNLKQKFVG